MVFKNPGYNWVTGSVPINILKKENYPHTLLHPYATQPTQGPFGPFHLLPSALILFSYSLHSTTPAFPSSLRILLVSSLKSHANTPWPCLSCLLLQSSHPGPSTPCLLPSSSCRHHSPSSLIFTPSPIRCTPTTPLHTAHTFLYRSGDL